MTRTILRCAGFLAVALAAAPGALPPADAATRRVTTCTDNGAELRAQVAAAAAGDTIELGIGCHITLRAGGTIVIDKDLTVAGWGAANTSIDGGHVARVFHVTGGFVVIGGLSIRNGRASGNGGGIRVTNAALRLSGVHVVDNFATTFGGGIAVAASAAVTVDLSTISGNAAGGTGFGGGGIDNAGHLTIVNSTISGNSSLAVTDPTGGGGGILVYGGGSQTIIRNSTIANNFSAGGSPGHGVRAYQGHASLENTIVGRNGVPNAPLGCGGEAAARSGVPG